MTKIGRLSLPFFIFCLLSPIVVLAAKVQVQAYVDRNELGLGDTLQLTVSVSSSESVEVSEPRVPNLDRFNLLNSWTSSAVSSKLMPGPNGMQFETVRRQDFNYMLTPTQVGQLQIPAFEVTVDGQLHLTKPIVVRVTKEGSGGSAQPPSNMPGFDEMDEAEQMFNQLLQRRFGQIPSQPIPAPPSGGGNRQFAPKNPKDAFFIDAEVDKTDVYEGEQITVSWYIYTRGNILSLDRLKFPDLRGFWKEIIEEVPALNFTQEIINGVPYRRALLASHALFPIKPGTSYIDEYKVKASVQLPSGGFGGFGLGQAYSYTRSSEKIKINVRPLPTQGRPQDFSGAVGEFEVSAGVEGQQFPINQPFSLKIRFEGQGNAKLIELPPMEFAGILEKYDTKTDARFFKTGRSYKEFEVLLIPRQQGEVIIPGISVSLFDPRTNQYYKKTTQPIPVQILSAEKTESLGSTRLADPKSRSAKKELPPLVLERESQSGWVGRTHPIALALVYLMIFLGLGWQARNQFAWGQRRRNLLNDLTKKMKKTEEYLKNQQWREFGAHMTNIYYFVLGEISGLGGANLEIHKLMDHLPPSVRRDLGSKLAQAIETCQILSFAPEAVVGNLKDPENMRKFYDESKKLLENAVRQADQTQNQ